MKGEKMNIRASKRLGIIGTICAIFLFLSATGLKQMEVITGENPEIIFHTTASSTSGSSSSVGFDLQHAKSLGADIHAKGNGHLKWQGETVDDRGGTLGAYTEVVNIFNETDYTLHEVYDVLVKDHPELLTSGKQPYSCDDVNKHFGFSVEEDKKCTISEIKDLLYQGKLVQKMVSTNEWRNSKGEQVSWPGSHTGLLFYYDGKYFHMKAAGKIRQTDALYTEEQLAEWMGGQEKKFIVYTKTSSQATSSTKASKGKSGGFTLPKLPTLPIEKNNTDISSMSREEKIEESVRWELSIAEDDSHGYNTDSDERFGQHGEYCCSTLSIMSWERLGVPVRSKYHASQSKNVPKAYKKAGFKDVTNQVNLKTMEGLERGDVLLNKNLSHTETYIGDGKVVGAHKDSNHPERGDQKGNEISVTSYSSHSYGTVLRYYGD